MNTRTEAAVLHDLVGSWRPKDNTVDPDLIVEAVAVEGASDRSLRRTSYLLVSDFERLEEWCRLVDVVFDHHTTYLVGSVLTRPDFRDVDLRCILPDAVFDRYWRDPLKVRYVNRAVSIWGQKETALPIDFQVQRQTEANAQFSGYRNPMGFRDWTTIVTSGVPGSRVAR